MCVQLNLQNSIRWLYVFFIYAYGHREVCLAFVCVVSAAGLVLSLMSSSLCLKALCAAVVLPDVLQTMNLVFSGADVMCATGDPENSAPYLLAQKAGQRLQMEFLHHNKLSGTSVYNRGSLPKNENFVII